MIATESTSSMMILVRMRETMRAKVGGFHRLPAISALEINRISGIMLACLVVFQLPRF